MCLQLEPAKLYSLLTRANEKRFSIKSGKIKNILDYISQIKVFSYNNYWKLLIFDSIKFLAPLTQNQQNRG